MKNKKGTYDFKDIAWIAITIGVGIIVLAITATIIVNLREDYTRPSATKTNESDGTDLLWSNSTNMTLDEDEVTVLAVYNCTDSETIGTDNYTVFSKEGYIQCDTNSSVNGSPRNTDPMCVNYTYLADDYYWNTTEKGQKGQLKFAGWLPTIGLVLGAVIIITTLGLITGKLRKG